MIDYSSSGIIQTAFFEILDRQRRSVGVLEGVRSASRERNIYSQPRSGASIDLVPVAPVDWMTARVRMWGVSKDSSGQIEEVPLFTGIPMVNGDRRDEFGSPQSLKLLDYSTTLDVPLGKHYGASPGDLVTDKVRTMLATVGATDALVTDASSTVSSGMFWSAADTKRRYLNDLLATIGYSAVWADDWGRLHAEPYVAPGDRPVVEDLGFVHGRTCTYRPEFTVDCDAASVPNHAVVVAQTMGDLEPVVGEAWLPDEHPYSYVSRGGYEIPLTESSVDLAVTPLEESPTPAQVTAYRARLLSAATSYAARALQLRSTPTRSYVVENRWRPFDLHTATRFAAPSRGAAPAIQSVVTVAKDTLRYVAGHPLYMTTTLLEVVV